jgi:hypothetical protein
VCHSCGCRDMPLLRDDIAEHERVVNLGGATVRALDRGDQDQARALLSMADELGSHWRGEEDGLFAVMASDDLSRSTSSPSCVSIGSWPPCWSPSTCRNRRTRTASGVPSMTCTGT